MKQYSIAVLLVYLTGTLVACGDASGPAEQPAIVFDWLRDGVNREIYRIDLDGRDTVRLTNDPGDDQQPTAAGGVVVFTSYRDGNGELYAVPSVGGIARRLTSTPAHEGEAALSRDGTRLAFITDITGVPKLWLSAADGSNAQRLTGSFGFEGSAEASPSWSPGGDRLVFVSTTNGSADIFMMTPGGAPTDFVTGPAAEVEPAWSPSGNDVAFVSDRDGDTEIYVVSVASGQVRRLTNRPGIDAQPSWLADGRVVYTAWVDGMQRLRWLDPAAPDQANDVNLGVSGHVAQHSAAVF